MNNKNRVVIAVLVVLLLALTGYIVYDKTINKKETTNNNELIEKVMKDNPSYNYVDIGIYNKQDIDYEYSEFQFNINFYNYGEGFIDITFEVQNNKLIYYYQDKRYESTRFNNVKKATMVTEGTIGPQCMIVLLTTDGNLYSNAAANDCSIEGKMEIEQLIANIDKSFEKIDLSEFKVEDFKIASSVVMATDLNNNKKSLMCSRGNGCEIVTKGLDIIKTIGMGQDSYKINTDGSINIGVIDEQIKYNNTTLKIQSIFEAVGYINDRFTYYVVDQQGYLYKIELMFDDKDEEYYNIYKQSESPVKKIGYQKLNDGSISLIFICEDGTKFISNTQEYSMYDFNNKIGN